MAADTDPLAELRGIEPVPLGPTDLLAESLAALAVGLVLAMVIAGLIRPFASRRASPTEAVLEQLARTRNLPPDKRAYAQATLLHEIGDDVADLRGDLRKVLYRRHAEFDPDAFDKRIVRALEGRR